VPTLPSRCGCRVPPGADDRIGSCTRLYGVAAEELLRLGDADPSWLAPLAPASAAVRGEVKLAVEQGMALGLSDILDRRNGLLLFSDDYGLAAAPAAVAIAGELLGWTNAEVMGQLEAYRLLAAEHGVPGVAPEVLATA
jgi:glycerol-3-phosphate dehydrogenase